VEKEEEVEEEGGWGQEERELVELVVEVEAEVEEEEVGVVLGESGPINEKLQGLLGVLMHGLTADTHG